MLAYHLYSKKIQNIKLFALVHQLILPIGEEKEVPYILRNYEFLWRLRTEFFRRTNRLMQSLYYYFKAKYITKKYEKILFIKID